MLSLPYASLKFLARTEWSSKTRWVFDSEVPDGAVANKAMPALVLAYVYVLYADAPAGSIAKTVQRTVFLRSVLLKMSTGHFLYAPPCLA